VNLMARKFSYRGKSIEELRALTVDEFMGLIDSRKRRALQRAGPKIKKLLEKKEQTPADKK